MVKSFFFNPMIHRVTFLNIHNILFLGRSDFYEKNFNELLCIYYVGAILDL